MPSVAVGWRLAIQWLHCEAGRTEEGLRRYSDNPTTADDVPIDSVWLQTTALLGDCAVYFGRQDLAADCYRRLLPYAERFWFSGAHDVGYVARYLGRMAAFLGRPDDAERHLRYALRMHREKQLPYWEARSALDLAAVVPDEGPELRALAAGLAATYGFGLPNGEAS
jgi:hypothetical protein